MKTNYLTLSVMALAAAFTACSQDNEIPETNVSDNAQALTIQATESGFEAAEKEGRATDDGKITVFENGDQMGLFVVRDNGSVVKSNEPITYNGTTWTTTTPVYYYTDADYIAYFPYDADLSVSETTTTDITDGIISAFNTYFKANKEDQSNLETYRNADLMLATITAGALAEQTTENKILKFDLKHNYSMIELNVPSYKYSYTYGETTREFSVPMSNFEVILGTTEVKPCHIGDGVYRMLVEPEEEITLTGSFDDPKDQRPVNFSNSNATTKSLAKGNYVKYNISYEGAPSGDAKKRDIIGDYYCQDGSIYPSELQAVPTNAIGIVFSTVGDADFGENTSYEYYVVSVKERNAMGFLVPGNKEQLAGSNVNIEGIPNVDSKTQAGFESCLNDMSGLESTNVLRKLEYNIALDLDKNWTNDEDFKILSTGTTGWFIPSAGQWAKLVDIVTNEDVTLFYESTPKLTTGKDDSRVYDRMKELLDVLDIDTESKSFDKCCWGLTQAETITEGEAVNSRLYCLDISNKKFEITLQKKDSKRYLRPILAF